MFAGGIVVVVLGWGCIQLIKYSPSTHKTLDLIPNPTFTISTHRGIEVILCNLDEHLGYVRLFFFFQKKLWIKIKDPRKPSVM